MMKTDAAEMPARAKTGISRRNLFALAGASAAVAATPASARTFGTGFTHGVASGEPHSDSVLLWTRYVGEVDTLTWRISKNADLSQPVSEGYALVTEQRDYCVKAIAKEGLEPDTWYYFQFGAPDGTQSEIGRTRTLPEGPKSSFKLAVFSCSNFGFGYFNAYAHAAEANDCDLALHLGDYIYEYGAGTYPSAGAAVAERVLAPESEIVALADYRLRYATYRADPDLRRLHQVMPMIAVWDDHESANDSWKDGAQNHQEATEGDWEVRKAVAKRVYREWMPVSDEPYAAYDIGNLATLFRLDTRLEGRDEQFSLQKVLEGQENPDAMIAALTKFREGEWADPERQLMGEAQEQWLADGLARSKSDGTVWQVLVQQVLMGKLSAAPDLLDMLGEGIPPFVRNRVAASAMASQAGLPLNMDAWDGYPAARDRVFESALEADANLLVLAGDTHNGWAFELGHEGEKVGVELGVCSVSSPGFETYLPVIAPDKMASLVVRANDELKWADTSQRGYMAVELTPTKAITEYRFIAGIKTRSTRLAGTKRVESAAGSHSLKT
ncbi:alkaline phosphatase D family protein [Erythrobacter sp. F6033]|uniref:alkaline phosphatase D family protein n=1 Tax=Erythrobacter sp. F6033 TaxID=2926401 RepID=UPI001FF630B0|nr:alkaline phosphatase D family protein [Erythrobacter sp. F6033]MCK0129633.1 alkaline phosphatase D family protein [Erythrobacter sp. F6033]